jgi:hypothetical protein
LSEVELENLIVVDPASLGVDDLLIRRIAPFSLGSMLTAPRDPNVAAVQMRGVLVWRYAEMSK